MDEKAEALRKKIGNHWAVGLGASLLGGMGLLAEWLGSRKAEDPAVAFLKELEAPLKDQAYSDERARWASMRAGEWLRQAILADRDKDRHAFMQAAVVHAMLSHSSQSASKQALLRFGDLERKLLSDMSVEIPEWDRTLDFIRERHNDILEVPELREKLLAVSREIEEQLRGKDGAPKDLERSVWRTSYGSKSKRFADLTEDERAEIMQEHANWTAASLLSTRWERHAPESQPSPA